MKKKTFIVQLLDSKNPSRKSFTQVEDANFYSNDTDASLVFIPHEDTFEFQSAKVVMYNRGDESLVERDAIVTTENGRKVASYELPAEIIAHWGDWTAQPVFTSGGEIYSGSIVPFSVIRYLMHERPATLTEIVTVTEFIQQSQALVDDMEQAEAQRVSAESSRISAETQRASNETVRVSAEAQRETDHANRSAELAGKADKVVLRNLVENGDFSTNEISSNFVISTSLQESATIVDGKLVLKPKTFVWNNYIRIDFPQNIGDVIYCSFTIESPIATQVDWRVGGISRVIPYGPSETTISFINKVSSINNHMYLYTQDFTPDMVIKLDNIEAINLTQTFGAGNEPTKEEMDELIKVTGYMDGEYALNNKEMLDYLMKGIREKANKKQENWQSATLTNGVTGSLEFMKDDFGFVHLRGTVTNTTYNTSFTTLPSARYAPKASARLMSSTPTEQPKNTYILVTIYGTFFQYTKPIALSDTINFDGCSYYAGI